MALTYTAFPDLDAYERVSKTLAKVNRKDWFTVYARMGGSCAAIGAFGYAFGAAIGTETDGSGFLVGGLFGLIAGLIWGKMAVGNQILQSTRSMQHSRWQCEITDANFRIMDKLGNGQFILWSSMKMQFEDPDAWLIKYGEQYIVIFRKSLRDAGLEDEFRSRLP